MQSTPELLPVRGNSAIEVLKNDHLVIKTLLRTLTQASDLEERSECLEQLKGVLTVHNATEENIVYPAINRVAKKTFESLHLYYETANAEITIFELDTMLKEGRDDEFQAKAEKLRDAVMEHIDDEEKKAFPHLEDSETEEQEEMLMEAVREFRHSLHFELAGSAH